MSQTVQSIAPNAEVAELVRRARSGSHSAMLTLYKAHCHQVFSAIMSQVGAKADAEDIMQESFLSAFTKLNTFKGEVTFGAWLKRIVVNNSIYH